MTVEAKDLDAFIAMRKRMEDAEAKVDQLADALNQILAITPAYNISSPEWKAAEKALKGCVLGRSRR